MLIILSVKKAFSWLLIKLLVLKSHFTRVLWQNAYVYDLNFPFAYIHGQTLFLRELTHDKINFYIMPSASMCDKNFMHLNICIFSPVLLSTLAKRLIEFIYNVYGSLFRCSFRPSHLSAFITFIVAHHKRHNMNIFFN